MTDQELNEIEARDDFTIHCRGDVSALIAEVRQLRAERDVLIGFLLDYDKQEALTYAHPNPDAGCWLMWARNEVEKAKKS